MLDLGTVTDTSGITDGDGHWLHDHADIMANPEQKNALADYKTRDAALIGGYEAKKFVGRPHINIPGDDADQAAKDKFAGQISEHSGAVANVDDFKLDGLRPDGADETNYNFAAEKAFLGEAVNLKMSQSQMGGMLKMHNDVVTAMLAKNDGADKAAQDAAVVQLTSDCGGEANYKVASELNTRCLEAFFDADTAKMIEEKGMGNHVGFFKGIQELAKMAVKEGRSMPASPQKGQKAGGALRYKGMEEREKQNA